MKKLLFAIFNLSLALLFALSGCSCKTTPPLAFNKAYLGDGVGNYSETLEYSIEFAKSYQGISSTSSVDEEKLPKDLTGTYVSYFSNATNSLPSGVTTNIDYENDYHYIRNVLSLSYSINGKTFFDQMVNEVYFHSKDWSFAPVYSKTTMKYTYFIVGQETLPQVIYQYSTSYDKANFKTTKTVYNPETSEDVNLIDITDTDPNSPSYLDMTKFKPFSGDGASHEYSIRTAIDNNQLLFAIRNSNVGEVNIPTISFSYDNAISLIAKSRNDANYTINNLNYNGTDIANVNMPIKNVEFYINSTTNAGSSKYLSIQKEAVGDIKNNALIVEYAEPFLSGLSTVGALVYKLNKVTINN